MPFETTWMDLESIMLNKLEKDKHCTFSLNVECKKQNNKLLDIEEKIKARGLGA